MRIGGIARCQIIAAIAAGIGGKSGGGIVAQVAMRIGGIARRDIGAASTGSIRAGASRGIYGAIAIGSGSGAGGGIGADIAAGIGAKADRDIGAGTVPVLLSLALELVPTAVFAPWVVPLLALALVPQATSLTPTAALAPAPLRGALPSALPAQTNCACAGRAPKQQASATASATVAAGTTDPRSRFINSPPKVFGIRRNTPPAPTEYSARKLRLSCSDFFACVADSTLIRRIYFSEFTQPTFSDEQRSSQLGVLKLSSTLDCKSYDGEHRRCERQQ
jgi:hypothetical protein